MKTKICSKCQKRKLIENFYQDKRNADGRHSFCKDCKKKIEAVWRDKNRDQIKKRNDKYRKKNKELILKKQRENYDPVKRRVGYLVDKKLKRL